MSRKEIFTKRKKKVLNFDINTHKKWEKRERKEKGLNICTLESDKQSWGHESELRVKIWLPFFQAPKPSEKVKVKREKKLKRLIFWGIYPFGEEEKGTKR